MGCGEGGEYTQWQMVLSGKEPDGKRVLQWSSPHEQCPGISIFCFFCKMDLDLEWSGVEWGLVVSFLDGGGRRGLYCRVRLSVLDTVVRIASRLLKVSGRDEVIWMFEIMVNDVSCFLVLWRKVVAVGTID